MYMTNLKVIAQQLGISIATVSRALNDKPGINVETRQRVLAAATALKYGPNVAARSLATASTNTIGFLTAFQALPLETDPFYLYILRGAELELARHHMFLVLSSLDVTSLGKAADVRLLSERRVDGLIVAGPFFPKAFLLSLKLAGIPMVLVDNALAQTPVDAVLVEDEQGGWMATTHLFEHGHRKIVALSGPAEWISSQNRVVGYTRVMLASTQRPLVVYQHETTVDSGYRAMTQALAEAPDLTAVFAVNDAMAMGAIKCLQAAGRSVPKHVAVVGFDDVAMAALFTPPLTTIHVPTRQLGIQAARRLVDLLRARDDMPVTSRITPKLVLRASCGCDASRQ
jgi:DNA-binding LacI/PurR family transcriptional regulator